MLLLVIKVVVNVEDSEVVKVVLKGEELSAERVGSVRVVGKLCGWQVVANSSPRKAGSSIGSKMKAFDN